MQHGANEAFSRVLIDKALEFSGWNLLDPHQVRFELNTATGRADYLLGGQRGPLCVLEAKREDVDPYDAKEQARGYAENVKAPFIILSNGREHWFWNYTRKDQDAYRIERLAVTRRLGTAPSEKSSAAASAWQRNHHARLSQKIQPGLDCPPLSD